MKKIQVLSIISLLLLGSNLQATPPSPNLGMRWVLLEDYSDEFDGSSLNLDKWNDFHPWWNGRTPALFSKDAISVSNGKLVISNGILDTPQGDYKYYGGAVTSKKREAHYGYFECRFIASMTRMSTTFWLSNAKVNLIPGNCATDRYSQELDIQECIGNPGDKGAFMRDNMSSNTHYRYVACGATSEKFYSQTPPHNKLSSGVGEEYHTYGAWWKDATHVTFYADNKVGATTNFNTSITGNPFDRPMFINMVTETYDWTSPVVEADLLDETKNKSYYDWIRTYKEVPVNQEVSDFSYPDIYEEGITVKDALTFALDSITFTYEYKANLDREINIKMVDNIGNVLMSQKFNALKGFGKGQKGAKLVSDLEKDKTYSYIVDIRPIDSSNAYIIAMDTSDIVKETFTESLSLNNTPGTLDDTIRFRLEYTADVEREINFMLTDKDGIVKMSETQIVPRGIVNESIKIGLNFEPIDSAKYTVTYNIRPVDSSDAHIIDADNFEMIREVYLEALSLSKFPGTFENIIRFQLEYTAKKQRELNFTISDTDETVKMTGKQIVNRDIVIKDKEIIIDFTPVDSALYTITFDLRLVNGNEEDIISHDSFVSRYIKTNTSSALDYSANSDNQLFLYPNPASSSITIMGLKTVSEIKIFSYTGQMIRNTIIDKHEQIDVSNLSSGIYFVQIEEQTLKFIKK